MRDFKNLLVTGGLRVHRRQFCSPPAGGVRFAGRVVNLDKLTYAGNPLSLADIPERDGRYLFIKADIATAPAVARVMDGICP
jgi:dTDP-glucose 4,6-dehydratase